MSHPISHPISYASSSSLLLSLLIVVCFILTTCTASKECEGDVVIHHVDDVKPFVECTHIKGSLRIDNATDFDHFDYFPKLEYIEGELHIWNNNHMGSLSFPSLLHVGSSLLLLQNAVLFTADFPSLQRIGSAFQVWNNAELLSVSTPKLNEVLGAYDITFNPHLSQLPPISAQSISSLHVANNGAITCFQGLDTVREVRGNVMLSMNLQLSHIRNLHLESVTSLTLQHHPLLRDISPLSSLTHVQGGVTLHLHPYNRCVPAYVWKKMTRPSIENYKRQFKATRPNLVNLPEKPYIECEPLFERYTLYNIKRQNISELLTELNIDQKYTRFFASATLFEIEQFLNLFPEVRSPATNLYNFIDLDTHLTYNYHAIFLDDEDAKGKLKSWLTRSQEQINKKFKETQQKEAALEESGATHDL